MFVEFELRIDPLPWERNMVSLRWSEIFLCLNSTNISLLSEQGIILYSTRNLEKNRSLTRSATQTQS